VKEEIRVACIYQQILPDSPAGKKFFWGIAFLGATPGTQKIFCRRSDPPIPVHG